MDRQVKRFSRRELLLGSAISNVLGEIGALLEGGVGPHPGPLPEYRARGKNRGRFVMEALEARRLLSVAPLNLPVTIDPGVQQDPSIAVNPNDSSHLVVTYMDRSLVSSGYAGIGTAVSHDGGQTWTTGSLSLPSGFDQGAANPVVHFDAHGKVYVVFMSATFLDSNNQPALTDPDSDKRTGGLTSNNGIFSVTSDDGGTTWSSPVAIVSHLYDGTDPVFFETTPDFAIDNFATLPDGQANPQFGEMYAVWTRLYPSAELPGVDGAVGGGDAMIAVSKDHGASWQTLTDANGITVLQDPVREFDPGAEGLSFVDQVHIAIGPEGDLYVSNFGGGDFVVQHSTDDGATFTAPDHVSNDGLAFGAGASSLTFGNTLPNDQFRTNTVRAIVADPTRPGMAYAVEPISVLDASGNPVDEADVNFARSSDYGVTWTSTFKIGASDATVLNDDNGGQKAGATGGDVTAGQSHSKISVDDQGDIAVIWYDTRRDPANHLLDVFGTVSTDGGLTFSPNFRLTDVSFDPDQGQFVDATGAQDFYLGDYLGLTIQNNTAFAAWTDTRNGNQDIYFRSFSITAPPVPLNDRFEPNDTPSTATDLGTVIQKSFPKLNVVAGDEDWYSFTAAATGPLDITSQVQAAAGLNLELWDATGTTRLAAGATHLSFAGVSGTTYLVHVTANGAGTKYSLQLQSLTKDLGTQVFGLENGTLGAADEAYYLLNAGATGTLNVALTPGSDVQGNLKFEILDSGDLSVLGSDSSQASVAVNKGQSVLLHVLGADANSSGSFTLSFTDFDQYTESSGSGGAVVPAGLDPSQSAVADLNGDGRMDIVSANAGSNTISVLLGNGDGTFQAPRQFSIGAFRTTGALTSGLLPNFKRDIAIADFNGDGIPDVVVTNYDSGDVSVLLGNGDGSFQAQRRFNAVVNPFGLDVGDVNGDGKLDIAVVNAPQASGPNPNVVSVAVLLNRGDGSFLPPEIFEVPPQASDVNQITNVKLGDFNGDEKLDALVSGSNRADVFTFLGNGDGTFTFSQETAAGGLGAGLLVNDMNGDGIADIVDTSLDEDRVFPLFGDGTGNFSPLDPFDASFVAGQSPVALAWADLASVNPDDGTFGGPDGHPDLIIANSGIGNARQSIGPASVVVLPTFWDENGFEGFGTPAGVLYVGKAPTDVDAGDFNGDGVMDIAVTDVDGVHIVFGGTAPAIVSNDTPASARNLGTVVHVVEPTLSIVPGHTDAYFNLTAPTEAVRGAGDEIMDFSGLFENVVGAGLSMELLDASGNVIGSGSRFRVSVQQGEALTLHVFGIDGAAGAYTLDIDTLPQIVSIETDPLLPGKGNKPGGATSQLVITFQGERLDPTSAENPANYVIRWLGPDGIADTSDDQIIPIPTGDGLKSVVYNSGDNIDVTSGIVFPTAVRQTVCIWFNNALPAGGYQITVSGNVESAEFNDEEETLLANAGVFGGHPLVTGTADGEIVPSAQVTAGHLVSKAGTLGSFEVFRSGTRFLTQLHSDLGALLDATLTLAGDQPDVTAKLLSQIAHRMQPSLGASGQRLLVLFLDPVSLDLADPSGNRVVYDLSTGNLDNQVANAFVSVASNVEVVVMPMQAGEFDLKLSDVPQTGRGGALILSGGNVESMFFTQAMRAGVEEFTIGSPAVPFGIVPTVASVVSNGAVSALDSKAVVVALAGATAGTLTTDGQLSGVASPGGTDSTPAGAYAGDQKNKKAPTTQGSGDEASGNGGGNGPTTRPTKKRGATTKPVDTKVENSPNGEGEPVQAADVQGKEKNDENSPAFGNAPVKPIEHSDEQDQHSTAREPEAAEKETVAVEAPMFKVAESKNHWDVLPAASLLASCALMYEVVGPLVYSARARQETKRAARPRRRE